MGNITGKSRAFAELGQNYKLTSTTLCLKKLSFKTWDFFFFYFVFQCLGLHAQAEQTPVFLLLPLNLVVQ